MFSPDSSQSDLGSLHGYAYDEHAQLALDTLALKPTHGIPVSFLHVMDTVYQERIR